MISEKQAKKYCKDDISLIENYDIAVNDKTRNWVIHHRRETIYSKEGLIEIGEYYHRPACELIFLTKDEHNKLHHKGNQYRLGKYHSEETKKKLSEAKMGNHHRLGKGTKPIIQYYKDGVFIRVWSSATEASLALDIDQGDITRCCRRKRKSAGGFVWAYADDKLVKVSALSL